MVPGRLYLRMTMPDGSGWKDRHARLQNAMDNRAWAASNLAARLLAGPWTRRGIAAAVDSVLGAINKAARANLIDDLTALAADHYPPAPAALRDYLLQSLDFRPVKGRPVAPVLASPRFAPLPPFATLPIPALATPGDLAAWLGETPEQLAFLADHRRCHRHAASPALQHYRYAVTAKQNGKQRLIEAPKPRLKAIQRRILHEILGPIPVHDAAHGFVTGRSCLTGAQIHAGEAMVLTFDLAQFFPAIGLPRVHGIFRGLGYPWAVARLLAGLCTTITPAAVLDSCAADRHFTALHEVPHLPQGAPTSPALANLLAYRLDSRLHGLARAAGAHYTRYADDLAFSGDDAFAKSVYRFQKSVETIAGEEGFALNPAKSRIMKRGVRQRITGILVNAHCNTGRAEFETLKAILHNCARAGPASQNRASVPDFRRHLEGRIAWAAQVNLVRGLKLWGLFDRIDWTPPQNQDDNQPPAI